MITVLRFLILSCLCNISCTFHQKLFSSRRNPLDYSYFQSAVVTTEVATLEKSIPDLTGYKLWCTFDGFGVKGMKNGIELRPNSQSDFAVGLKGIELGFWRVVDYDDGRQILEITHPVLPEYLFFFDIWEPTIVWKGQIDKESKKIINGQVTTNKKRFGIFPYTDVIATFTADLLTPDETFPEKIAVSLQDEQFMPPADFMSPYDMRRYPEIFNPEFVDWFFEREDALAKGEEPPVRTKPFFLPQKKSSSLQSSSESDELERGKLRPRRGPSTSGSGLGMGNKK